MKSLLFSLTVVSVFLISHFKAADSSSASLDIPKVIDLNSSDLVAIQEQIQQSTIFAELEIYDKYGEKIYQSQDAAILLAAISAELTEQTSPLLYVLKFNASAEEEQLNSQIGQLIW